MNDSEFTPSSEDLPRLTLGQKIRELAIVARDDFNATDWRGKVILAGMIATGGYEWGPGNESLIPLVAGQSLDVAEGHKGIVLSAAVAGGLAVGQQLASGFLARKTTERFPNVAEKAYTYMQTDEEESIRFKPFNILPTWKKVGYSVFLGSSFNVVRESFVVDSATDNQLKKISRMSSLITGTTVALVGGTTDTVNQHFDDNGPVQLVIDWGVKNPAVWVALGIGLVWNASRHKGEPNDA